MNCLYREREKGRVILYNKVFVLTIYECRTDMDVRSVVYMREGGNGSSQSLGLVAAYIPPHFSLEAQNMRKTKM